MSLKAVLDACVLFSAPLRDTLLRAENADFYSLVLTDDILEELRRNLLKRQAALGTDADQRTYRLVSTLKHRFENNIITDYQRHIASMPINAKDRHVMAAALESHAQIIVTHNLKDFPANLLTPYNITAWPPDRFLLQLLSDDQDKMQGLLMEQAAFLNNPPMTVFDVLDRLTSDAPEFAALCRQIFTS